jgi:hypothetical protein
MKSMNIRRMRILSGLSLAFTALLQSSGLYAQFMTIEKEKEPKKMRCPLPPKKSGDESLMSRESGTEVEGLPKRGHEHMGKGFRIQG